MLVLAPETLPTQASVRMDLRQSSVPSLLCAESLTDMGSLLSTLQYPGADQGHSWGRDTGTIQHSHTLSAPETSSLSSPQLLLFVAVQATPPAAAQQQDMVLIFYILQHNSLAFHCSISGIMSEASWLHIALTGQEQT